MYERFTDRARKVMQLANQEAQRFNHEYIGTEHILLGLIKEGSGVAANVLKNLDIDLRKIRLEVEKIVKFAGPDMVTMGKLPQTPRAKKVIEYSIEEARDLNHNYVGTEHLLLGLLREQEGIAAQVLMNLGLRLDDVRGEVLNLLAPPSIQAMNTEPSRIGVQKEAGLQDLPEPIQMELKGLEARIREYSKEKVAAVAEQDFVKAAYLVESASRLKKRLKSLIRQARLRESGIAYEYDLFIPQIDKNGTPIDERILVFVKERLHGRFGGFVQRVQKIAGTWKIGNVAFHDEVTVFQIVAGEIEQPRDFFQKLKEELKSEMNLEVVAVLERRVVILSAPPVGAESRDQQVGISHGPDLNARLVYFPEEALQALEEINGRIGKTIQEKEEAIAQKDFERAASLRDKAEEIKRHLLTLAKSLRALIRESKDDLN